MAGDTFTVERSAEVAAPPDQVFAALVDFHQWPKWSPWEDIDPDMERTFSGADSGVGAVYAWKGNRKAGEGRMEITGADSPSSLAVDLRFIKPFKSENDVRFAIEPSDDGSRVTWTMVGPKTFGVKVMSIFKSMDKMVGPDFEKGLRQLDEYLSA
jgi:uncharacterized protein YndB with AHSA1/START domain